MARVSVPRGGLADPTVPETRRLPRSTGKGNQRRCSEAQLDRGYTSFKGVGRELSIDHVPQPIQQIFRIQDFRRQIDEFIRTYFCGYTFNALTGINPCCGRHHPKDGDRTESRRGVRNESAGGRVASAWRSRNGFTILLW